MSFTEKCHRCKWMKYQKPKEGGVGHGRCVKCPKPLEAVCADYMEGGDWLKESWEDMRAHEDYRYKVNPVHLYSTVSGGRMGVRNAER